VAWTIETDLVLDWLLGLDQDSYQQVISALEVLADQGPQLGRPLVDTIAGSRLRNMKELRPGSAGRSEVRVLFIFDPQRKAILLVAGDKSGHWDRWYRDNIPLAEKRYEAHLDRLRKEGTSR
jgi:hypothetical protein